eukprot:TRINITY_DN1145_c0_g3_i1.p1 TRINITY_DN1145_c0_g3~~TRINITY_DN1145_c0_g3_i1.p1  ORF type:complete len:550 (+),score=125.68 TRINITY_DN1145_c0_g3_i1:26-1675(+)
MEQYAEIDAKLKTLRSVQKQWLAVPISQKISMLEQLVDNLDKAKDLFYKEVSKVKKTTSKGEEWFNLKGLVARNVRLLVDALKPAAQAQKNGEELRFGGASNYKKVGDQYRVNILPYWNFDLAVYPGFSGEVWIQPGKPLSQGAELKKALEDGEGAVALVLGAGNQPSIGILDAVYKLIHCHQVVFLKHNPVNEYLYEVLEIVFENFIAGGYFQHCKGGASEGQYLVEKCDNVHITGSDKTHDMIVWGKTKDAEPKFKKEISSELGCVSPLIIVPGDYSKAELTSIANHIAGGVQNNCSFNCNAVKILVTYKQWKQRDTFLKLVEEVLTKTDLMYPYYPGARDRYELFRKSNKQAKQLGDAHDECLPWLWIPDVDSTSDSMIFNTEPFSPVLSETPIDAEDEGDFMHKATNFCNDKLWGNLSASLFIHPTTEKLFPDDYEYMVSNLRYGSVSINHWAALQFLFGGPWGAYPGNKLNDIQSGIGFVHNFNLLDHIEKGVVKAPLNLILGARLPYRSDSKYKDQFMNSIVDYENNPSMWTVGKVSWAATWN